MQVINSGAVLLKMELFHILFLLSPTDRYKYIADIDTLNGKRMYTLGLYEYRIETIKGEVNEAIPLKTLRDAIDKYNIVVRLMDDIDGNHHYAFDSVDFSLPPTEWRQSIHSFIIQAAEYNYSIIKNNVDKTLELKQGDYQTKAAEYEELLDILTERIAKAKNQYSDELKKQTPHILICRISTTHYRKRSEKYGILIKCGESEFHIFFKSIDQKMLYIAAMLRYKAGFPLYLNELIYNSTGINNRNKVQKNTFKRWIKQLYSIIVDMDNRDGDDWLMKIAVKDNSEGITNKNNPIYQAKSDANRCVKTALKSHTTLSEYCCIKTKFDENGDSYYTFSCPTENITVDRKLQKLVEEYSVNSF